MPEVQDYDRTARGIQSEKDPVQFMGSEPISIAAGAEATITFEPEYDLNPQYLRLSDALAPSLAITGMKIGPVSVMAGGGLFPGDAFKGSGTLRIATALPVTQKAPLKVTVRNLTTGTLNGVFLGLAGRVKRAQ